MPASILALATAVSIWLSLGTLAVSGGDAHRIAALPSLSILAILSVASVAAAKLFTLRLEHAWPLAVSLLIWLPYLPIDIPDAFLIWQGPLEGLVWLVVVGGLMAARPPAVPVLCTGPHQAPWLAAALVVIAALLVFSQVRNVVPGGDEPHYLAATQSVLKDGDLRVANNYAQGDYLQYFPGRLEPHFLKRSVSGEIYSIHAPGVSVVVLPAFALAGYAGAVLTIVVIAALSAALAWRLAFRVTASAAASWIGVAAVFATPPYFFHTFTIYPEIIGGFCVLSGVWLLVDLAEGREPRPRMLIAIGSALALLPWLHSRFAVLAGILGVLIAARLAMRERAAASLRSFLIVPVVAAAAWFAYFYAIWGSPSPMSQYGADTSTSSSYILRGLIGLLVDQQFGLAVTAPILLIAVSGIVIWPKSNRRLALELLLIVVPYAIVVASYAMWWAGSAAPARFLIAVVPLAALPTAVAWKTQRNVFVMLLLIVSVALVGPRAFAEDGRFIFNNRGGVDGTLLWLSSLVDLPQGLPSVHRDGGSHAMRAAMAWLAVVGVAGTVGLYAGRRSRGAGWTMSALLLALGGTIAVGSVAGARSNALVTPDRSKLAALAAYRPWHSRFVDLSVNKELQEFQFMDAMTIDVTAPAVRLNRVPAGEYDVMAMKFPLDMTTFVGRNDPPIDSHNVGFGNGSSMSFRLRLPVAVATLNLAGKEDVGGGGPWMQLRPVRPVAPAHARYAVRATRYGDARVFFFDEWAYLEKDGFWTRANGSATVVIDDGASARTSGRPISVTAGAVPTTVRLSVGGWQERLSLTAGERREVVLPPIDGYTRTVRVESGPGFRPSEREPGNRDVRELAAWISLPR